MAIGTEDAKILYTIIIVVTINMIKLNWDSTIIRLLCPSTYLTGRRFEAHFKQSFL